MIKLIYLCLLLTSSLFADPAPKEQHKQLQTKEPAFHGYCVVCFVDLGLQEKGHEHINSYYKKDLYFFASHKQKKIFDAKPERYTDGNIKLKFEQQHHQHNQRQCHYGHHH